MHSQMISKSLLGLLLRTCCLLLFLLTVTAAKSASSKVRVFDVRKYGAVADGKRDNTKVFLQAWKEACQWRGKARIYIPKGRYMVVGPLPFVGPCKGYMMVQVQGSLIAPYGLSKNNEDSWIRFQYINGLKIFGGGTFDGQGASAWKYRKCTHNCRNLPVSIRFDFVTNGLVQRVRSFNSKAFHINVFGCKKLKFKFLEITAPDDSPNTDGIHMGHSNEVTVYDSHISTGDDCISIGPGSFNTYISKVVCGPGHGISVGSLGKYPNEEDVVGLIVRNCTLKGTDNGLRIKTWAPSPPSIARNFTFEHIFMDNVHNPIIIDQDYCPSGSCGHQSPSQVHIHDLTFKDIWGASGTKLAVDLSCSSRVPCRNVKLHNIHLSYKGNSRVSTSSCSNVEGTSYGHQIPPSCIA
ncbi:hypothetical protein MKW98_023426 [Papaver atlanticum]|uniref:Exopolygalacturonase-like n=1 Tax=Papaver atlanticum TaxID=357466 RepID=A0AAD4SZY6_9MAGN|nr:hypothetical protein MKW98_023426 [Papaver atlanticum]